MPGCPGCEIDGGGRDSESGRGAKVGDYNLLIILNNEINRGWINSNFDYNNKSVPKLIWNRLGWVKRCP